MGKPFVLDASIALAWCFEDEASDLSDAALQALADGEAFVPPLWSLEVSNVLLVAERKSRISQADTARLVELLNGLPIVFIPDEAKRVSEALFFLARQHGLSSHDAVYLNLALHLGLSLATQDVQLRAAAKNCGVPLFGA